MPAGEYCVDFVIVTDDGEYIVVGDTAVDFAVNFRETENNTLHTGATVGYGSATVTFISSTAENFKMVGGVPIPTVDNLVRCIVAP